MRTWAHAFVAAFLIFGGLALIVWGIADFIHTMSTTTSAQDRPLASLPFAIGVVGGGLLYEWWRTR